MLVFKSAGFLAAVLVAIAGVTNSEAIVKEDAFKECQTHCGSEHVGEQGRAELLCVDLCRLWNPAALD